MLVVVLSAALVLADATSLPASAPGLTDPKLDLAQKLTDVTGNSISAHQLISTTQAGLAITSMIVGGVLFATSDGRSDNYAHWVAASVTAISGLMDLQNSLADTLIAREELKLWRDSARRIRRDDPEWLRRDLRYSMNLETRGLITKAMNMGRATGGLIAASVAFAASQSAVNDAERWRAGAIAGFVQAGLLFMFSGLQLLVHSGTLLQLQQFLVDPF